MITTDRNAPENIVAKPTILKYAATDAIAIDVASVKYFK